MTRSTIPARGWPRFAWLVWAVGIVPVMFVVPPYLFPLPFALPSGVHVSVYDARRLLQILWATGLLLALLHPPVRAAAAGTWCGLSVPTRVAAGLFVAWALLSALVSSAPAYALREWSLITLLLVAVLPLRALLVSAHCRVLEVTGLTLVLYAVLTIGAPLEHGFLHPRFQGDALAVTTPALLFSGNPVLALMGAPALALGILNGTRALLVTLVVVAIAAAALWPGRWRRVWPGLVGIAVAGVVVAGFAVIGHDASLQEAAERGTTLTGRGFIWGDGLRMFLGAPLLGVGPGLLARAGGGGEWIGHPHNSVLLIAAETGIVGLASIGVLVVMGVRRLPGLAPEHRPWALGIIGGGTQSMFSGAIIMPASQALLFLALALALPVKQAAEPDPRDRAGRPDRGDRIGVRATGWALTAVGAVALVVLLVTLPLPSVEAANGLWRPRFFGRGIIP